MFKNFFTKEELKMFSKKGISKIKREDFYTYLEMEQAILDSLVSNYETSSYNNPLLEEKIEKQKGFVDSLNKYYYEVIVPDESITESFDGYTKEFKKEIKMYKKIQKEVK